MICNLCQRKCNKERNENTGSGTCGMPLKLKLAHYDLFMYEEPCISLGRGSGAIFFSGCNLKCVFCQNYEISALKKGKFITTEQLANIFKELEESGAENINLVSGSHYVNFIVEALKIYKPKVPIIYNSNGYESENVIKMLADYVDIFLPDFKYYDNEIAEKFSGVSDYYEVALNAIKTMRTLKEDRFDENGKMLSGVLIRHMILPLCTDDSCRVLDTIQQNFASTKVSLMAQYTPCHRASEFKQINRKITKREYDKVLNHFNSLALDGYVQELSSASKDFIPKFKFI